MPELHAPYEAERLLLIHSIPRMNQHAVNRIPMHRTSQSNFSM
jgi:hypothetical protein